MICDELFAGYYTAHSGMRASGFRVRVRSHVLCNLARLPQTTKAQAIRLGLLCCQVMFSIYAEALRQLREPMSQTELNCLVPERGPLC